jgi:D-glutamate cyclase
MSDPVLTAMRDAIQIDPGGRGLATDPKDNLFTACPGDLEAACQSVAALERAAQSAERKTDGIAVGVVTGFFIAHGDPPCGETDGPLGALFLARALTSLGVKVTLFTDSFCSDALKIGLAACALESQIVLKTLLPTGEELFRDDAVKDLALTHLVALERPGPGPDNCCRNMRGRDITAEIAPAHRLFENADGRAPALTTIGIGDGGNEIGMGKIPRDVIQRNIPNGGLIACRVPTDYLIVAGVSNWGAYALAAGIRYLRRVPHDPTLFDPARERELLEVMVERGPLVDGPSGKRQATVDGLPFEEYAKPLIRLGEILRG